jgi:hypothetical protein
MVPLRLSTQRRQCSLHQPSPQTFKDSCRPTHYRRRLGNGRRGHIGVSVLTVVIASLENQLHHCGTTCPAATSASHRSARQSVWIKQGRVIQRECLSDSPFLLDSMLKFSSFQKLVFLMTARMAACSYFTNNRTILKRIEKLFMDLQSSATPISLVLTWVLSPAKMSGMLTTTELFTMLCTYVDHRRKAEPTSDAIDVLIADGETTQVTVEVSFLCLRVV